MKESKLGLWVIDLLEKIGLEGQNAVTAKSILMILGILIVAIIANFVTKHIILNIVKRIIKRTKTTYDDIFITKNVFQNLSHLVPALIIYYTIEYAIPKSPEMISMIQSAMYIYMILVFTFVLNSFLNALHEIYSTFKVAKKIPIKGYIQVVKIIIIFICVILIVSILLGKSPLYLLGGLGALAAVLLLVFKDTILGFMASIQLTAYDMVRPGDWISMPSQNSDGDVLDISLTTVKVQNFDKTISTIPTYALVSQSFKNWKGMSESGGRRISRSINIDMKSIRFCDDEMIKKFEKIAYLKNYIKGKKEEIEKYNTENNIDRSVSVNGRAMTNIGTFRKYLEMYLHNHPKVHKDMTLLVRQQPPTEKGLPIQVYCFANDNRWSFYEEIQADIFDHILAVVPEFGLKIYQYPSGEDFQGIIDHI